MKTPLNILNKMEIHLIKKEIRKDGFLTKLTLILLGIFVTSSVFAFSTQIFPNYGLWIGLTIIGISIFSGFYYIAKGTRLRLIAWSMLVTLILGTALFIIGIEILSKALEGL